MKSICNKSTSSGTRLAGFIGMAAAVILLACCSKTSVDETRPQAPAEATTSAGPEAPVGEIVSRYRSTDSSIDSTTKLKASVESQEGGKAEAVQLTIHHKKEPDGSQHYLVDFTLPAQERDRDALINVRPTGEIEATRYAQSTGSFLTARSATDEESLFGLTLQELVGGQPEKYDYKLIGEEQHAGMPVYKVEGTLKPGAESRFSRTVMLISKENYTAPVIEAYDNRGQLARKVIVTKSQQADGNWLRWQWTVDNLEQHKKIDFTVLDAKFNQGLPD